jgi:hypothetical protein
LTKNRCEFYQYNEKGNRRMPLDITISPLYRVGGKDQASLPGLMAAVPPARPARSRDQDRLVVYLLLSSRGILSSGDCVQAASRAAVRYYATPGTMTAALRTAAQAVNQYLHERNHASPGQGLYAVGVLALGVVRDSQLTLLISGPMQAYHLHAGGSRHIADSMSGRGLGLGLTTPHYFQQLKLVAGDRVLLGATIPSVWEAALRDARPASFDATRRRLMAAPLEDLNAVLVGISEGAGVLTVQRPQVMAPGAGPPPSGEVLRDPAGDSAAPSSAASMTMDGLKSATPGDGSASGQALNEASAAPSAYALPPHRENSDNVAAEADRWGSNSSAEPEPRDAELHMPESRSQLLSPEQGRRAAKAVVGALDVTRSAGERFGQAFGRFLPRLLPGQDSPASALGSSAMMFVAVLVPLVVVTIASAVYFRYGRSVQYEQYLVQAQDARAQAVNLSDPVAEREAWQRELFYLDRAEAYTATADTRALRSEAQAKLDELLGIVRLDFQPVLSAGLGVQVGRLAAADNDLYVLDAQRGSVLHVGLTESGFRLDSAFNCAPGAYGDYTVGPIVDIVALPDASTVSATVLGIDSAGNLLYCSAGQVAQAAPLPPPDTNWGRVKAFTLDGGNLYVLDARAHAVWVYVGKDGTFVDRPYFFFGGQIPELEDAIDLAVSADDLFVLHSDGRLSTCSYSRIEAVPTRCVDPAPLVNALPAYRDLNLFSEAHFTQMEFSPPPDPSLALLDADGQGIFRIASRSLELQNQWRALPGRDSSLPAGPVRAMTMSPNHVLYFALRDRLYFATDTP